MSDRLEAIPMAPDEQARAEALLGELSARPTGPCGRCGSTICPHQMVIAHVMGHKDRPLCATCLSSALGRDRSEFLSHAYRHITHRACFLQGWEWASAFIGRPGELRPAHLFPSDSDMDSADSPAQPAFPTATAPDAEWDAGGMGCGDLVLELRMRLMAMEPRKVLRLRATDPGAPEDIPAWCRMTGHALLSQAHPEYLIRRRDG